MQENQNVNEAEQVVYDRSFALLELFYRYRFWVIIVVVSVLFVCIMTAVYQYFNMKNRVEFSIKYTNATAYMDRKDNAKALDLMQDLFNNSSGVQRVLAASKIYEILKLEKRDTDAFQAIVMAGRTDSLPVYIKDFLVNNIRSYQEYEDLTGEDKEKLEKYKFDSNVLSKYGLSPFEYKANYELAKEIKTLDFIPPFVSEAINDINQLSIGDDKENKEDK